VPEEAAPVGGGPAPSVDEIARRVTTGDVRGPGIRPEPAPVLAADESAYLGWAATNLRQQKQAG
jgi:hypothetical protein